MHDLLDNYYAQGRAKRLQLPVLAFSQARATRRPQVHILPTRLSDFTERAAVKIKIAVQAGDGWVVPRNFAVMLEASVGHGSEVAAPRLPYAQSS